MFIGLLAIVAALPVWALTCSLCGLGVIGAACLFLAAVTVWPVLALLLVSAVRALATRRRHDVDGLELDDEAESQPGTSPA